MHNILKIWLLFLFITIAVTKPVYPQVLAGDSIVFAQEDSVYSQQQQPEKMGGYFYRVFFVTAIIILLLFAVLFVYKKLGGQGLTQNRSKIHIISRQTLGPKQAVIIVAIEGKKYVLGTSDHAVNLIAELGEVSEDELPVTDIKQVSQNFTSILSKLIKK